MTGPIRGAAAAIGAFLVACVPCRAAELHGRVELVDAAGRAAAADPREVVVWFEPDAGPAAGGPPARIEIGTRDKDFDPRVAVVPVGSTVAFPNGDPILHNVFSVSGANAFDLGLYGPTESRSTRFDEPGVVRVYCNVHHSMAAYVVVLGTPHHGRPGPDGRFVLAGLPAAPGTLTVWHERAEAWTARVDPASAETVEARLRLGRRRVPHHLDKNGRPYRARDRERYD